MVTPVWRALVLTVVASASVALTQEPAAAAEGRRNQEQMARELARNYLDVWSSPNAVTLEATPSFYAPVITFYGRQMRQSALLDEKRRFVARWPVRNYRHRLGTMRVECLGGTRLCKVRSLYDYTAANPRAGRNARGSAALEIGISFAGARPVIVTETGGQPAR